MVSSSNELNPVFRDRSWQQRMAEPFRWTKKRESAALLIAAYTPIPEVAQTLNLSPSTVKGWFVHPDFKSRCLEERQKISDEKIHVRIASMTERVAILDRLAEKYLALISARAEGMAGEVEGGETGLLTRRLRHGGPDGPSFEYVADVALTAEIREFMDLAARDLGQRVEKREIGGSLGLRRECVLLDTPEDEALPWTEDSLAELDALPSDPAEIDAYLEERENGEPS